MSKFRLGLNVLVAVVSLFVFASMAQAQATRTWVSGVGDDVNPCSRTAPCKTFAGAISKTARDGEINVIDSGGFGTLTITKSITVNGGYSEMASVLFAGGINGINVNITDAADTRKQVRLLNLKFNGASSGNHGINFIAGSSLHVSNCEIYAYSTAASGINWTTASTAELSVSDTTIMDGGNGINISPTGGSTKATLSNVKVYNHNSHGILVTGASARVAMTNITASGNAQNGISVQTNAKASIDGATLSNNTTGLNASGGGAVVSIANVQISQNGTSVNIASGDIHSFGNNRFFDNTSTGSEASIFGVLEK